MTVRKQITIIIGSILLIAVLIYSVVSAAFVNKYFSGYVESEYNDTVERIKEQSEKILDGTIQTKDEAYEVLSIFSDALIGSISILDSQDNLIVNMDATPHMMRGQMMGGAMNSVSETDYFDIQINGEKIGTLVIGRTSAIRDSQQIIQFKRSLRRGALFSGLVAFVISVVIIIFAGEKMTKDLRRTASAASIADNGSLSGMKLSGVAEIRSIQQSLRDISSKLGLQKRARREKVDQLSHEVRTPLTILKTNVEGVRDKVIEMDDKRIESCLIEIDNLTSILSTISDVVEYDDKELKPVIREFDVGNLLEAIVQGFKLQFYKKSVSLSTDGKKHMIVSTDKSLLSQAIYNLISNAYKFTPKGGKVSVILDESEEGISVSVCDSGIGVPDDEKDKIFDAYQRGSSQKNTSGDGLGLYIAKNNIQSLGGTITVNDNKLGGSCFAISLPAE